MSDLIFALDGNPLLDLWTEHEPYRIGSPLWPGRTPSDERDAFFDKLNEAYAARREACSRWSWAVPDNRALNAIAGHGRIVEIGAGRGYWARLLSDRGVDIVAYDWCPPGPDNAYHPYEGLWFDVEHGGPERAGDHPDRTLFLCWPPMTGMATDALRAYVEAGGTSVVYVGEGTGGCTGDDEFHGLLGLDPWCPRCILDYEGAECICVDVVCEIVDTVAIPQWDGLHDSLYVAEVILPGRTQP